MSTSTDNIHLRITTSIHNISYCRLDACINFDYQSDPKGPMDPLLSSLCTICHIDPPKYTCPRCYVNTCSLTCSKRHKIWASCSGLRDPTRFKPMSELATPAGIDHDYNFLRTIETRLERSEKLLVEEIQTVTKAELDCERRGQDYQSGKEEKGEACVAKMLRDMRCRVVTAPRGMRRNKENTTVWNRKHRTIFWQVEWLRGDHAERTLYRALGDQVRSNFHLILQQCCLGRDIFCDLSTSACSQFTILLGQSVYNVPSFCSGKYF